MQAFQNPMTKDTLYRTTHKSGLDIIVWPQPKACSTYAVFATRYGSVHNTLPTADGGIEVLPEGIAHYLEHKLFESEEGDAFTRFAVTGADANAYTSFERTAYLFHATENILPSLEILLDFVQHPYFTEETVRKEQGIIGQEIRMCEDDPDRCVLFNLLQAMYRNHPVRIDIAGTVESIANITAELLYRCYERYYNLHNMVLVVAGKITPDEVMDAADRLLRPAPPLTPLNFAVDEPKEVVKGYVEEKMPVAAPLFYLGFKEPKMAHNADTIAGSRLLSELIAGKSSALYAQLMKDGLINAQFGVEYFNGPDFGVWLIGGESADPKKVEDAVCKEIRRLQTEGIARDRFDSLKKAMYGQIVGGLDDASNCAELVLGHVLDGIEPLSELQALAKLTCEDIERQLRERIPVEHRTLSVVLPQAE
ncbi:MAG: insulinase family protein [Clostridia bacterium]|nr:insulinase family protein [Clostridia bacterium]